MASHSAAAQNLAVSQQLHWEMLPPPPEPQQASLNQRLLAVTQAMRTHAEQHEDHWQLRTALQRSQPSHQALWEGLQQSVGAQASFEANWKQALAAMGLAHDAPLAEAGKRATQRVEVARLQGEVRRLQDARAAAQAAETMLRQHLQALPVDLAEVLPKEALAAADALQAAHEALKQQRQTFDAHAASTALQTATADKEAAITDIHAAAADYVAYALATDLLEQAMEKLRAEQQDPLIVHAGQLFAACTKGAFVGMQAGLGDRGEPKVFGKRRTGEQVCVSQMSDGSRDQLFLSFRLASIYSYCRAAEPLPFVADDLLVHFDEERSAATLGMLAELGQVTQVLLFTHHQHVLELAQPLVERQAAAVVRLD